MSSNHVPLILGFKMTFRKTFRMSFMMTFRMTLKKVFKGDFEGDFEEDLKGTWRETSDTLCLKQMLEFFSTSIPAMPNILYDP